MEEDDSAKFQQASDLIEKNEICPECESAKSWINVRGMYRACRCGYAELSIASAKWFEEFLKQPPTIKGPLPKQILLGKNPKFL